MRAFVALEISDGSVLDALVSFQNELTATGADLKLVERQNLHFTVKFLGEISEAQAQEADRRLRNLKLKGGDISVAGVGVFPTFQRPNVVWAGVSRADEPMIHPIAEGVIRALEGIGERDSRPFQAHLTLARVRSGRNKEDMSSLIRVSTERPFGKARLTTFRLKSSQLLPSGPVYGDVGVYALG